MDLFSTTTNNFNNFLPTDGEVYYYGKIFTLKEANVFYNNLIENIEWKNDEAFIMGKLIITKRKVAWYGEKAFEYTYSKTTKSALPFTEDLVALKKIVEQHTNETYNSCLLNLYHSGTEGMGWHSDGEKDLKKNGAIASLSFGAERKFAFKHKINKQKIDVQLEHGSLLVMKGETQTNWQHRLPPTTLIHKPRMNLTFRTIID